MENNIIPDENGKGFTLAFKGKDVEFVNPIEYWKERAINHVRISYGTYVRLERPNDPVDQTEKEAFEYAHEFWEERCKEITETEVPDNLMAILTADRKHKQVQLLKNVNLTPEILLAFIFRAYKEFGFSFSQYTSHLYPPNIDRTALPRLATLNRETGQITKSGQTTLSDAQIKHAITNRKVVIAKFIDSGSEWHAFYITFKSIGGEESWKNGQTHFHYASDKFGVSREEVLKRFKKGDYQVTSVHIPLLDYGNQPNSNKDHKHEK